MEIDHILGGWQLSGANCACAPQRLSIDGKTVFSFLHSRIDGASDDAVEQVKAHGYHRGGCAVYEGSGLFMHGASSLPFHQISRIAANTFRLTTDLVWPKTTALKSGIELGSVVLGGGWQRYFTIDSQTPQIAWHDMPASGSAPVAISPLPAAIVFERADGLRLEFGLGDDLWRWRNAFNSESLKGAGKLEISASGGRFTMRRWVTQCPPPPPPPKLPAKPVPGAHGKLPSAEIPLSYPDARPYRFNSYIAWSAPMLQATPSRFEALPSLDCSGANGISRKDLEALEGAPAIALDLRQLPVPQSNRRTADNAACWCGRATQRLYRRIIRQLADFSPSGRLRLDGMTPGWCSCAAHANRKHDGEHWDLCAIIDAAIWTRQIMGDNWEILIPQTGIWAQLPSLQCLAGDSGFRGSRLEAEQPDGEDEA